MRAFILDAPNQLREASKATAGLKLASGLTSAMLLGMGGSALSAGLITLLRARQRKAFPWEVVRDYALPHRLDSTTLALALSYSGNTEETLAALDEAAPQTPSLVAVSHGGRLAVRAAELGVPHIQVPDKAEGFQPRFALPFMFGVVKSVLESGGLLEKQESLEDLADWLEGQSLEELGQEVAAWLGNRLPAVYASTDYELGVARTWRIKFNENTKLACLWGCIPEVNHNEMMAYSPADQGRYGVLLLSDPEDDARVARRFPLMATVLEEAGHSVRTIEMVGRNPLERAMASLMLADWVTYHVALQRSVDPVSIPAIQEFKKRL